MAGPSFGNVPHQNRDVRPGAAGRVASLVLTVALALAIALVAAVPLMAAP
ncbi:hypothetical protein [Methylobacterium tarhaniae]|nr:hypothetical protein [Methylobacterium tarhaniae]